MPAKRVVLNSQLYIKGFGDKLIAILELYGLEKRRIVFKDNDPKYTASIGFQMLVL